MEALLKKLNFKAQSTVVLINLPDELEELAKFWASKTSLKYTLEEVENLDFALFFVTQQRQIDEIAQKIKNKLKGDAVIWFAYPKGTSKKYQCDFNRDTGWEILGKQSLEGVRQIAIDENWSALRFRKVAYIKKMTRRTDFALSEEGKAKTQ